VKQESVAGDLEETLEGFRGVAAASVSDAVDAVIGRPAFMSPDIRAVSPGKLVGPAATVLEGVGTEARPPLHALQAIDTSEPGTVIVIGMEDPEAGRRVAVWGGLMTTGAMVRGLAGAVLDAGLRDVQETREAGFPVFARSVVPATTVGRFVTLDRDIPLNCGGVLVRPGDIVVGDMDGVVVVPLVAAREVLAKARELENGERRMVEAIERHGSILAALKELGRI
jgi:4-hydroxy-4-methyl-2-oxoglutarate aldolase